MAHVHHAAWVLPIVPPPIRDGWVAIDRGRIVDVGEGRPAATGRLPDTTVAILPGLVNAHTHLELSWMRGKVPPGDAMPSWAERLIGLRRSTPQPDVREPIVDAIREARASGTTLVGDVGNTVAACEPLAASPLSAVFFLELIGFRPCDCPSIMADAQRRLGQPAGGDSVRAAIAAHAPYSVSPDLLRAIGRVVRDSPLSIHLGESRDEIEFLAQGTGRWRTLLERIGAWTQDWTPPRCGPVEYLDRLGLVHDRLLAVHGVELADDELQRLAAADATVVTCPRSNRWTGAGAPPIERFYAAGVRVAIGTDSLASVEDLNMFNELAAVRRIAPRVPAARLLRSATLDGARALGFQPEFGSIERGKRADLIAVRVPPGEVDVEEYLLGGIEPCDVTWLNP
jgi:cytosine/adenosine deaminase-related metal-dependent hydrolase